MIIISNIVRVILMKYKKNEWLYVIVIWKIWIFIDFL